MRSTRKYKPVAQKWNLRPRVPVNKIYWEFHKGDADFNPSVPHGHSLNGKSLDGKYKLELWSGKIYDQSTGELKGVAKPKDMLRLYQTDGFQDFVSECRAEYAKNNPHMQLPPLSQNSYITGMYHAKFIKLGKLPRRILADVFIFDTECEIRNSPAVGKEKAKP